MKRSTLQMHHEVKGLVQTLLWSLCIIDASALLHGQQNGVSPDFLSLSIMPLQSTEEDSISSEPDYQAEIEEMNFPLLTTQNQQTEENNRLDHSNNLSGLAELVLPEKFNQFSNDPYKKFGIRSKRNRAKNMQVFYLLGIFSRSINQAKWRRQRQQREQEKAKSLARQSTSKKPSQSIDELQVLAYTGSTSGLSQQNRIVSNQTLEDNKRTIFVSRGWAPSGGIEKNPRNQKLNTNDKGTANANMYAFTSNHWGPLGKRNHPTSRMRNRKARLLSFPDAQF